MKRLPSLAIVATLATLVDNLVLGSAIAGCGGIIYAPVVLALLTGPSLLLPPLGTKLLERLGLQRALHAVKAIELVGLVMIVVLPRDLRLMPLVLPVLGIKAALLAPIKYSGAARLGDRDDVLLKASMTMATATAVSMVAGIFGGYYLFEFGGYLTMIGTLGAVALVGWSLVPSTRGDDTPAAEPTALVMSTATRRLTFLGIGWFWFLATLLVGLTVPYALTVLGGNSWVVLELIAALAGGFVLGSLTCSLLSRGYLELGVVPLGALGITVFTALLWVGGMVATVSMIHAYVITALCGVSLAWYVVPLYALLHQRTEPSQVARVAARCDQVSSAFAVAAAGLLWLAFAVYTVPTHWLLLTLAALNAAIAFFTYAYMPEFALRFVIWLLAHVFYRVQVIGRDNLPRHGPAVLVCNHVTFVDWLIIGSASSLPLRFVMHYSFMNIPVAKYLFKDAKIIPIAGAKEDPATLEKAFERIATALADNEIVCIFPEGKLTTDGKMNVFRPGIEKIIGRTPVPVTPMALVGMWGSMFSRSKDKRVGKRIWSKVTLLVAPPVAPTSVTAASLEATVRDLGKLP